MSAKILMFAPPLWRGMAGTRESNPPAGVPEDQTDDRDRPRRPMGEINGKCPGSEAALGGKDGRPLFRLLHLE